MSSLFQDAKWREHVQSNKIEQPFLVSKELKGKVGKGVDEIIFRPNTLEPIKNECKEEPSTPASTTESKNLPTTAEASTSPSEIKETEAQQAAESAPTPQSFLRIYNVKTFFASSEATLTITPNEYKAAQRLGFTKNIDQAITAKVIGAIGDFRYASRRDAVIEEIYDDVYVEEEAICQTLFERVEALQAMERAIGGSPKEIFNALKAYNVSLNKKIAAIWQKPAKERNEHENSLLKSYQLDHKAFKALLTTAQTEANKPEKLDQVPTPEEQKSSDLLKSETETFIHGRLNETIRHARRTDELITIGSRLNPFRGRLTGALVKADIMASEHRFDQNRRVRKEHQGDFSEKAQAGGGVITISSSHAQLGNQKASMERFALSSALILGDPPPEDPMTFKADKTTTPSVGWRRIFTRTPPFGDDKDSTRDKYQAYFQQAKGAHRNYFSVAFEGLTHFLWGAVKSIGLALAGLPNAIIEVGYKISLDFVDLQKPPQQAAEDQKTLGQTRKDIEWNSMSLREQVADVYLGIFKRVEKDRASAFPSPQVLAEAMQRQKSSKEKAPPPVPLTEEEKAERQKKIQEVFQKFAEGAKSKTDAKSYAPFALAPYEIKAYDPDDILSVGMTGLENFKVFFHQMHEEYPSVCIYALALYAFTAVAIAAPAAVAAAGVKAKIPVDWFIAYNKIAGEASAHTLDAQVMSQALTNWQLTNMAMEGLIGGEDSMAGLGLSFAKGHLFEIIAGAVAVYGIGHVVAELFTPVQEELGSVPEILELFTGLKVVVGSYEAFESTPHERSKFGTLFFDVLDIAALPLRCIFSLFNLAYMAVRFWVTGKPINWANVARPWAEVAHKFVSGAYRLADLLLRAANFLGIVAKMLSKAFVDFIVVNLVFVVKTVAVLTMLSLFTVAGILSVLTWPISGRVRNFLAAFFKEEVFGSAKSINSAVTSPRATFRKMVLEQEKLKLKKEVEKLGTIINDQKPDPEKVIAARTRLPIARQRLADLEREVPTPAGTLSQEGPSKLGLRAICAKIWHADVLLPALLINAKFDSFQAVNDNITQGAKESFYKASRAKIARYLNRPAEHVDKRIVRAVERRMYEKSKFALANVELNTGTETTPTLSSHLVGNIKNTAPLGTPKASTEKQQTQEIKRVDSPPVSNDPKTLTPNDPSSNNSSSVH